MICPSFSVVAPTALSFLFIWQGNFAAFAGHSVAVHGSTLKEFFKVALMDTLNLMKDV